MRYKHYRTGEFYDLICIARSESNPENELAIYRRSGTDGDFWARPVDEFFGSVDNPTESVERRFIPVPEKTRKEIFAPPTEA